MKIDSYAHILPRAAQNSDQESPDNLPESLVFTLCQPDR
jgi:hypothetical protein